MAKAKQIMGGLMLEAVTVFGRVDRERCKELVRVMDAAEAKRRRPFSESPRENCGDPVGHADRLGRHTTRLRAGDPGVEPVHCWGPCGRTAVNGPNARRLGWKMRDIVCGPGMDVEVQCPECFSRWGFIEPLHSEG